MGFFGRNLPYLLAGISVGGQYALIAVGYTMVYGILRLINFAHGDIFTAAGFFMVYIAATMPLTLAIPLMIVLTVLLGFTVERVAYKPLRSAPRMSIMISAIGVSYLLQNLMWYVTGGLAKQYPSIPWISNSITIGGATTKVVTIITPILTVALVIGLAGGFAVGRYTAKLTDRQPGAQVEATPLVPSLEATPEVTIAPTEDGLSTYTWYVDYEPATTATSERFPWQGLSKNTILVFEGSGTFSSTVDEFRITKGILSPDEFLRKASCGGLVIIR